MKERKRMDMSNTNTQLIIAGMAGLIDDGFSPHEVFEILEDIKQSTFHALVELQQENRSKL